MTLKCKECGEPLLWKRGVGRPPFWCVPCRTEHRRHTVARWYRLNRAGYPEWAKKNKRRAKEWRRANQAHVKAYAAARAR